MNLISIRRGLAACLFFASIAAHAEGSPLRAEAVAGEPFGVCRVTLDTKGERSGEAATSPKAPGAKRGNLALLEQVRRASVREASGRALYPATWDARLGGGGGGIRLGCGACCQSFPQSFRWTFRQAFGGALVLVPR